MLTTLQRLTRRAETALLSLLVTAMLGLATAQILLRNLFDSGLAWGDPLLRVLVLWCGLAGALAATGDDRHIRIDLLTRYLPRRLKAAARLLTEGFAAAVCALFAWHGGRLVWMEYQDGTTAFAGVPAWLCEAAIPLGFGLMALRFLLAAVAAGWSSVNRAESGRNAGNGQCC